MKPYTLDRAEDELRAALDVGDPQRIATCAADVDRLAGSHPTASLPGAATWYAQAGLRVFPLRPGTSIPMRGSHGCKDAVADPAAVREWWDRWPSANVGIATGHLVDVIDFDGAEAHAHWGRKYGGSWAGLTVLGTVSTPRPGGLHVYVRSTGEGNRAGMLPRVDYRGRGGYVVAPPSSRADGRYRWLRPLDMTGVVS